MIKNRPSKKIVSFAIIAFGLVAAIFVSKYISNNPSVLSFNLSGNQNSEIEISYSGNQIDTVDSNSFSNSTDEEITVIGGDKSTETKKTNISDLFSQDLYSKFMTIQSYGDITDPAQQQELVDNLKNEVQSAFTYKNYSLSGLQTLTNPTQNDIRFYASSFATLQLNFFENLQANIENIRNDETVASKIYADHAEALYGLKVPRAISTDHLSVVNNMSAVAAVFQSTANSTNDPVVALSAIQQYRNIQLSQSSALQTIAQYLKSNDIIFTENETGNFWNFF